MDTIVQEVTLVNRKEAGIFYTPLELTEILCRWAVRTPKDRVLEPSFGGCNFLDSTRRIFEEYKNYDYINQLGGCDTDPQAFSYLTNSLDIPAIPSAFKQTDFLKVKPDDFQGLFDVVIGNPPYISRHNMPDEQIELGQNISTRHGYQLSKRTSLWGYFVLHSLSFLREGGRVAFILPSSFLYAHYAVEIRKCLQNGFDRSLVLQIGQRVFLSEGTSEVAVIVLCEGWHPKSQSNDKSMESAFVPTLNAANQFVKDWSKREVAGIPYEGRFNFALLPAHELATYLSISQSEQCYYFADFATVLIGMVTGDNKFFVIDREKAQEKNLPDQALRFIVAKYRNFLGLTLTIADLKQAQRINTRCLLFDTSELEENPTTVQKYLNSYPIDKRSQNKTFKKRSHWDQPDDGRIPDAFFTYMSHDGPAMRLNLAGVNCTNTVHRVFFNEDVDVIRQKLLSISLLTTFSQLSAEIESRSYGSGVLKHEPSEIKRFKLYMPDNLKPDDIERVFSVIDGFLRLGDKKKAQLVADDFILGNLPEYHGVLETLNNALISTRNRRIPDYKRK